MIRCTRRCDLHHCRSLVKKASSSLLGGRQKCCRGSDARIEHKCFSNNRYVEVSSFKLHQEHRRLRMVTTESAPVSPAKRQNSSRSALGTIPCSRKRKLRMPVPHKPRLTLLSGSVLVLLTLVLPVVQCGGVRYTGRDYFLGFGAWPGSLDAFLHPCGRIPYLSTRFCNHGAPASATFNGRASGPLDTPSDQQPGPPLLAQSCQPMPYSAVMAITGSCDLRHEVPGHPRRIPNRSLWRDGPQLARFADPVIRAALCRFRAGSSALLLGLFWIGGSSA